ncbi:ECF RNA polymerase sigma factor SigC [Micromonospora sp. MH33]|uniref:sigma-70 family RNA polymerase sigma factor n=1 Tax=Micromonospora sp. MH33 TaxID=1945509 RepID=UPI000D2901AB|nr:sigma-70 family RNA polymerase sigma factor [Micromonospora sp. MH33]PSK67999.1 ECF RNA polymerase sigma factor SigC [Micromonospora sp. MH33]
MDDKTRTTRFALAAGDGDQAAAAAFIRATQQQVWRLIAHLAGPNEADDLTQETYLRALRSLPKFTAASSARTWLFVIARRVVIDHHRAAAARPQPTRLEDSHTGTHSQAARAFPVEDKVILWRLLDHLPPERWEAFVATQVLGLSYAEAAEVCDCPVGTIRSRVARARDDLITAMVDADTTDSRERRSC